MTALVPGALLIPYGVDTWQPADLRFARQSRSGLEIAAPFPIEVVDQASGRPLRFNTASYHFDGMPDMSESGGDEWTYLKDLLKRLCRPWDRTSALLVDRYFAMLEDLVATHARALDDRLAPFAGLFERRHWLFSAPKPLPRAHVYAPAGGVPREVGSLSADDYLAVDFAFWTGHDLVVINAAQSSLTPRKARDRAERLAAADLRTLTVSPADLEGDAATAFFAKALAPVLPAFWEAEPIPVGPFRATAFAA